MPEMDYVFELSSLRSLQREGARKWLSGEDADIGPRKVQTGRIKPTFGEIYGGVLELLQRHDPMSIVYPGMFVSDDEYDSAADTILLRIHEAHSVDDMQRIVYEEFVWWFSGSEDDWEQKFLNNSAGPPEKYASIAQEIWQLWTSGHIEQQV